MNNYDRLPTKFDWVPVIIIIGFIFLMCIAYNDQETDIKMPDNKLTSLTL